MIVVQRSVRCGRGRANARESVGKDIFLIAPCSIPRVDFVTGSLTILAA